MLRSKLTSMFLGARPQPLGGRRWFFVCPRTGESVAKLHLPSGAYAFASRIIGAISAAALMTAAPASAATNLIADGTFSEGATAGNYTTYAYGTHFGPWESYADLETAYPASVDLIGTYWPARRGVGTASTSTGR